MNVLFRYAGFPLSPSMAHWGGHGGKWAWWCIYDILQGLGCNIDLLDWNNTVPQRQYDAIVSIQHLQGIERACKPDTVKILRLTAADPSYHNQAAIERTRAVNERRGTHFEPMRLLKTDNHIELADPVLLNGNEFIKRTYPEKYWDKIIPVNNAAGNINRKVDMRTTIPKARHWLWHAGSGAIHKGLDLCLEVFARHPEWTLHVTGNLRNESEFMQEYSYEFNLPNIHYHGWTLVDSPQFKAIVDQCVGFISPTCSEGQSPAVATCLTLGLYPIISLASGIDLPEGAGMYLDELTVDAVENAVGLAMSFDDKRLLEKIAVIQSDALVRYSRETFRNRMTALLKEALNAKS